MKGKAIIVSAPSGAGKTTIVKYLLSVCPQLSFSISACSRPRRDNETEGKDYYFISVDTFRERIVYGDFVEWQEVYPGNYYGTLKSELQRIWKEGKTPLFDVDVFGGLNLKKYFGDDALALFIKPPSLEVLEERLRNRGTEDLESLKKRLKKAGQELAQAKKFDRVIVNDKLEDAYCEALKAIGNFIDISDNEKRS
ncbi:MAG: guanylate kinase [Bacteroidota bacterium]|nr:guanylate kinase [Bacteroidota bacterium]